MTAKPFQLSLTSDVDLTALDAGAASMQVTLHEQQVEIARVLLAANDGIPEYKRVVVVAPRRCGKTTALWAVVHGLCLTNPGFRAIVTAQSGIRARERYGDFVAGLADGPYRARFAMGQERLLYDNGSVLMVVPPKESAFRGDAADIVMLDEAQEFDAETSRALLQAILPLLDTRPRARLIIAGTPKQRVGLLWDSLTLGREGKSGIVEYAAPVGADLDDEQTWIDAHPGIGTLTTLEVIRERHEQMDALAFSQEYLCHWAPDTNTRAIDEETWERLGAQVMANRPDVLAFGLDVAPDGSSASIVAAWRDDEGIGHIELVDQKPQTAWIPKALWDLHKRYPNASIGWDGIGANLEATEAFIKARPKLSRVTQLGFPEVKVASQRLWMDANQTRLRHYRQPGMDDAVSVATRRMVGDSWVWGRKGGDVTPLVAATVALYLADQIKPKTASTIRH